MLYINYGNTIIILFKFTIFVEKVEILKMSRHVPLDHDFNKEKYIELLGKARGKRQQKEFAEAIGMSKTYLNMFINEKFDRPLTPKMLIKIAKASEGRVSYSDLLDAAGYDPQTYLSAYEKIKDEVILDYQKIQEPWMTSIKESDEEDITSETDLRAVKGTIASTLAIKGYKWSGINNESDYLNFRVAIYDSPIDEWGFIIIRKKIRTFSLLVQNYAYSGKYGYATQLLLSMDSPGKKISFVTTEPEVYDSLITEHSYPALAQHVSAIMIDVEKMVVRKEEYIDTFYKDHKGVPSLI